uniref:Mitochondrial carrier protein n=1 Tax=Pseudo-nitzschia delicatissima TaxID=44447 RepID=A0A6T9Z7Q1_9STRA
MATTEQQQQQKQQDRPRQIPRTRRQKPSAMKRSFLFATMALACSSSSSSSSNSNPMFFAEATSNPAAKAAIGALKNIDYRYFVAGGTCAAFSHGITTPIDVVKTRLQANPEKYKGKGLIGATIQICKDKEEGGASTLLQGLGPTVLGYGIEGAMKFGAYEVTKPFFRALLGEDRTALSFMMASFLAGAIAAVLLVPMESLRIKQVTDPSYKEDTILTGLPRIFRDDGFWITMSGVWAMLAKQVPYTFGKQVSFDLVATFLYSVVESLKETLSSALSATQLKWIVSLLSAACASVAACLLSQPGDMILTKTYNSGKQKNSNSKNKKSTAPGNFGTVVSEIYGKGGVSEFYRGTQARLVHVGMIITSQLMVYDLVKQLLGLPATGSH